MLALFHETRDVFPYKDVEKAASARGIISQAVKDILKELVDDDQVHEGKVGISTFYWSFPGELGTKKRAELQQQQQDVARQREQVAAAKRKREEVAEKNASSAKDEASSVCTCAREVAGLEGHSG
mmetsp:Transcript_37400/g.84726  ORF Transcript_37400/g.84726 Transcript_37400/m.84726 type:complete len:125 (-) Transcript_37400:124-498(-)